MESAVRPSCALWECEPLLANTVTEVPPTAAVSAIENVMDWLAPAASENDDDGETVIPGGSPCKETLTEPANPVCPVTEIVTGAVAVPTSVSTEEGETESVKSGVGGGGGAEPPPQPLSAKASTTTAILV